jgi:hypothetical protein
MFSLFKSKRSEPLKTQQELIREHLAKVCINYDSERDAAFNSFADIYSIVCFANCSSFLDKDVLAFSFLASFIYFSLPVISANHQKGD